MKRYSRIALALVPGLLALTSCAVFFPGSAPQVTGQLLDGNGTAEPNWPVPTFGALIGFGSTGDVDYDNQPQIVDELITGGYTMELPPSAPEGVYEVIGFDDDGDREFEDGERIGGSGPLYFYFSRDGGDVTVFGESYTMVEGWNMINTESGDVSQPQSNTFGNVDLRFDE